MPEYLNDLQKHFIRAVDNPENVFSDVTEYRSKDKDECCAQKHIEFVAWEHGTKMIAAMDSNDEKQLKVLNESLLLVTVSFSPFSPYLLLATVSPPPSSPHRHRFPPSLPPLLPHDNYQTHNSSLLSNAIITLAYAVLLPAAKRWVYAIFVCGNRTIPKEASKSNRNRFCGKTPFEVTSVTSEHGFLIPLACPPLLRRATCVQQ